MRYGERGDSGWQWNIGGTVSRDRYSASLWVLVNSIVVCPFVKNRVKLNYFIDKMAEKMPRKFRLDAAEIKSLKV